MLSVFRSIPTQMDYKGQKLAEQIFQGIILVSAVIGFIYGYITEQFGWTVYIVMAGFALSCLERRNNSVTNIMQLPPCTRRTFNELTEVLIKKTWKQ